MREPRFDVLFEPISLGPAVARNRFYQSPHCNGMGRNYPTPMAAMRGVKAEGGWAVVFTEQCDIHPTTDSARNVRLWDEQDFPILAQMVDRVHEQGSLAGVMLAHNGYITPNLISRELPLSPSLRPSFGNFPAAARAMDKSDIRAFRASHRKAALNARTLGYDLVMIYAAHDLGLPMHFLSRSRNDRTDEYGGSLENRVRLLRELIEETKDAIGDTCGVGVRLSVDELLGAAGLTCDGEGREVVEMLAELPDWWDVNISRWSNDSATSRFRDEGHQEPYVSFVKSVTSKPVVGVGRFTSPDTMLSQIRRGILDMIAAARPSIADPFLPKKIEEGRFDDIRECIGCNICVTNNFLMAPIRCTQNPTMGEEWRRGWHPERVPRRTTDDEILIIGAGPAGLEAARVLGERGYGVMLADAATVLGGRVTLEAALPGLSAWARVRDYRMQQLRKLPNVGLYPGSMMLAGDVDATEATLVAVATGARWRSDGIGRQSATPVPVAAGASVLTPDDVMAGPVEGDRFVIYDDDHYYMASVIAEKLARGGARVTIVTPAPSIAGFTTYTLEIGHVHKRMAELGIEIVGHCAVSSVGPGEVEITPVYGGDARRLEADALIMVTMQTPEDGLLRELLSAPVGGRRVVGIGDCVAPGTIAAAVYAGHRFARTLGLAAAEVDFLREDVAVAGTRARPSREERPHAERSHGMPPFLMPAQ